MCTATTKTAKKLNARQQNWNGMNWITQQRRLAIYLRDDLACVYCGRGVEEGIQFTLDHVKPVSKNGDLRDPLNLVTACKQCNDSRGNRSVKVFAATVSAYTNTCTAEEIVKRVASTKQRVLPTKLAGQLIKERGSCKKVIDSKKYN